MERSGLSERLHLLLIGEMDEREVAPPHTRLPAMDRFSLLPYYSASDLIVLPSHYDGFPNVLIEAMTLRKPIIASAVGGMADILVDGETAFLFPPGDEFGCDDAIARAEGATDDQLRAMGERARQVANERCDARNEAQRYLEVLDLISGEQPSCQDSQSSSSPF